MKLIGAQEEGAVGGGLQIVEQAHPLGADLFGEPSLAELPRQVRGRHLAVQDGARDAEGSRREGLAMRSQELVHDLPEAPVLPAGEGLLGFEAGGPRLLEAIDGESGLGAADVSREHPGGHGPTG